MKLTSRSGLTQVTKKIELIRVNICTEGSIKKHLNYQSFFNFSQDPEAVEQMKTSEGIKCFFISYIFIPQIEVRLLH